VEGLGRCVVVLERTGDAQVFGWLTDYDPELNLEVDVDVAGDVDWCVVVRGWED